MRRLLALGLVLSVILGALASAPSARSADDQPPPAVIDTIPLRGEELPLDGDITIFFNQAMDRASVERAIRTQPALRGTFDWLDEATVRFKPVDLQRATTYTLSIGTEARSAANVPMADTFMLRLQTVGFLEVVEIIPANNSSGIEADVTISIIFNRPVVPLMSVEEMAALPPPFTAEPAIEGSGEWISTSIYQFKARNLRGGTRYTVTVPAGLRDVSGAVLQEDVTATFSTISPRLIETVPSNRSKFVQRDSKIRLVFSQPMDRASVEANFELIGPNGKVEAQLERVSEDKRTFEFKLKELLDYDTTYSAVVSREKFLSETGAPLSEDGRLSFRTVERPYIVGINPMHNSTTRYWGFSVDFSAPMNLEGFKERIRIIPEPTLFYDSYSSEQNSSFMYGFSHEPNTAYTAILNVDGLTDIYGTPLQVERAKGLYEVSEDGKAIIVRWITPDYDPELNLRTGFSDVGLYSAYTAQTRAFSTHRNLETINFSLYRLPSRVAPALRRYGDAQPGGERIRTWTVQVENPRNVLRYDLVTISEGASTAFHAPDCPGAPPSRLIPGEIAIVLPDDPGPLRLRASANLSARVVRELPVNTRLFIDGGPICADGYLWYRVSVGSRNGTSGWVAEGDARQYFIGVEGSSSRVVNLPRQPLKPYAADAKSLAPGFYRLYVHSPEVGYYFTENLLVATVNITLKLSEGALLAWVTDLQSGAPVPNLPVQLSTDPEAFIPQLTARTNADGIAIFKLPERLESLYTDAYVLVETPEHFGYVSVDWTDGIEAWYFNQPTNYYPSQLTAYIYTDRSLYRPGQPIHFRGILRAQEDMQYTLSDLKTVSVEIEDSRQQRLYLKELPITPFGSFSDTFTTAEDAPLGYYTIIVRPGFTGTDPRDWRGPTFIRGVDVAQYRVPEFQVNLTPEKPEVVQGEMIRVTVESTYFFGGGVSNAKVEWSLFPEDYFFQYKGSGSYAFVEFNEDEGASSWYGDVYGESITGGVGRTDAFGRFVIEVPADLAEAKQSKQFVFEARVTDESDQLIAGRVAVIVHQGEFYIGAAPENYVGTAEKPQNINLIAVGWDSAPKAGIGLSVRVVERRWSSTQSVDPTSGRTVWNWEVEELPITDGVATTDSQGKAVFTFTPSRGGIYKAYVTSRDSLGNQINTATFLWVAGKDYVPWRQQNSNRIDLKINKTDFEIGETASILITSPFQGAAKALISVERGKVLRYEVVDLPTNSYVYELPITAEMAPNAYVSVVIVKGVDENNPVAAFRIGLLQIGVDTTRYALNITVTPDREQASPRETVTYTIKVTNYLGEPVQAEIGVGLTDLAVLSLLPDTSPPILEHFYSRTGLSVRTAVSLTVSVDQQTQEILTTIKGGGGGGGPEGGIFEVRQRFIDTPLWLPSVVTDQRGEATVSVELPDQLTTWRLDARAITLPIGELRTTLVGQTTFDLTSTKPLLIRPITPRFYVVGDKSSLVAVVNNNSGREQAVTARIELTGARLLDDPSQTRTIPDGGRGRFEWLIEVEDVDRVDVTFFAQNADGTLRDAAKSAVGKGDERYLPVLRYEAPETVATGGTLLTGEQRTEGIALPRRFEVREGSLDIRLDRSLAAATVDALEVLRNFPHQCTEQTISRFLPNVATYSAFAALGLADSTLRSQAELAVGFAVQRLYKDQKADGGWGWFNADKSSPLVTAYALIGLVEARKGGFVVEDRAIEGAIRFLRQTLAASRLGQRPARHELNRQAFLVYAMAVADAGNFSRAVELFDRRELMDTYGRAYLAMAFHLIDPRNTTYTQPLLSDLINRAAVSATGIHWREETPDYFNWNTDTRTTAIVLKALILLNPESQLIPNVVRWLMTARGADAWETTQETAWSVMALVDWMRVTGELQPNYTFGVALNDAVLVSGERADASNVRESLTLRVQVADLLRDQLNRLTISRTQGAGLLYYTARLRVNLPADQVKAVDRGISVSRSYHLANDPEQKPITEAHVGDNIVVTLTIVAKRDLHYAMITDPIPAGAEAVNPRLATSAVGQAPRLSRENPFGRGYGWWWFSQTELRDEKVVLYATYLPRGTYRYVYTLRAGLAGEYRVMPATAEEFYSREVFGRSDGTLFRLRPASDE
ncbi:MAG: Ig-like domain-containing protein [Aggregatilineales bacterium]